jgi:1,4-dihydroxy-2-naphthoate octaprenyltransferase
MSIKSWIGSIMSVLKTMRAEDAARYAKAWWNAFRPVSLVIAAVSCGLGTALAFVDGRGEPLRAVLVMIAGLAIQSGVNLANDFFEFKQRNIEDKIPHLAIFGRERDAVEWIIFLSGMGFFALSVPIGLWLAWLSGWPLIALGAIGLLGGYFYTGEPWNYKKRGLGVLLVFFLMGILMIGGSYYAVSGNFSWRVVPISIPVSSLVSLILLSNEIRDFEYDQRHGFGTLTARIGLQGSRILFFSLAVLAYGGTALLSVFGLFPRNPFVFAGLLFLIKPSLALYRREGRRKRIIPDIMLHHFVFGALFIGSYFLPAL